MKRASPRLSFTIKSGLAAGALCLAIAIYGAATSSPASPVAPPALEPPPQSSSEDLTPEEAGALKLGSTPEGKAAFDAHAEKCLPILDEKVRGALTRAGFRAREDDHEFHIDAIRTDVCAWVNYPEADDDACVFSMQVNSLAPLATLRKLTAEVAAALLGGEARDIAAAITRCRKAPLLYPGSPGDDGSELGLTLDCAGGPFFSPSEMYPVDDGEAQLSLYRIQDRRDRPFMARRDRIGNALFH